MLEVLRWGRWLPTLGLCFPPLTAQQEGELFARFLAAAPAQRQSLLAEAEANADYAFFVEAARHAASPSARAAALDLLRAARSRYLTRPQPQIEWLRSIAAPSHLDFRTWSDVTNAVDRRGAKWWPLVVADEPLVVCRGLVALFSCHGLQAPPWVRRGLLEDPLLRGRAPSNVVDHEEIVEVLVPMLAQDQQPVVPSTLLPPRAVALPEADAKILTKALLDAVIRPRAQQPDRGVPGPASADEVAPNQHRCAEALGSLGAAAMAEALQRASTFDVGPALTILSGARSWHVDDEAAAAFAPPLRVLLDHADARIVDLAGELAGRSLAQRNEPALRAALGKKALAALRDRQAGSSLGYEWQLTTARVGPPPFQLVPGLGGGLVLGACRAGVPSLLEPLVDWFLGRTAQADGPDGPTPPSEWEHAFATKCLTELAPHLAPDQALHLLAVFTAESENFVPLDGPRPEHRHRLYASLPDEEAARLLESVDCAETVHALGEELYGLSPKRLRPLLPEGLPREPSLLLAVPERLDAAFRGDASEREGAVLRLAAAMELHGGRVKALLREGRLAPELVEAAKHVGHGTLPRIRHDATDIERLTALRGREVWSDLEERHLLDCLVDKDPAVRLAAFQALQTRDLELWDVRLFFAAAQFDPDPEIRRLAR